MVLTAQLLMLLSQGTERLKTILETNGLMGKVNPEFRTVLIQNRIPCNRIQE